MDRAALRLRLQSLIDTCAFDDQHYADLVVQYLRKFGSASRKEIDKLLWEKLSDALDEAQRRHKVGNLLSELRHKGAIANTGSRAAPLWRLCE